MTRKILVTLLLFSVSSVCLAKANNSNTSADFNAMIDSNQQSAQDLQKSISRSVSSTKGEKGSFDGDIIVAKRNNEVINPVKYNPFLNEDDEVQVKTWRDDK